MYEFTKIEGVVADQPLESLKNTEIDPHKLPDRWAVIADKEKVLFYKIHNRQLENLGKATISYPYEKEQNPGTTRNHLAENRSRYEPPQNSQEHEERQFLNDVSKFLDEAVEKEAYEELVITAAPQTMGIIREFLSKDVQQKVIHELDKDLSNHATKDIQSVLEKYGALA